MAARFLLGAGPLSLLSTTAFAQSIGDHSARFFELISNPDAAFVLLLIGIYAILIEVATPGGFLPGIVGVVCLVLAAIALSALPVQYGALALLIAGIALMTAEAFTPGLGVLGLLGFAAFVTGGYFLFDAPAGQVEMRVSMPILAGSAVASAALIFFVIGAAIKARRQPTATGSEQMLSERGTVIDWSGAHGNIRIHGEVWSARASREFKPGDVVRVANREGLVLVVEPAS
jgi:membrane-bound serine protease (ClpP class)